MERRICEAFLCAYMLNHFPQSRQIFNFIKLPQIYSGRIKERGNLTNEDSKWFMMLMAILHTVPLLLINHSPTLKIAYNF